MSVSMVEMPVWMNSSGLRRATGLMGAPPIGRRLSATTGGSPSMGLPAPSKRRPIISRATPRRATFSTRLTVVLERSMPEVSSKTCRTVYSFETSITWPPRSRPWPSTMRTIAL